VLLASSSTDQRVHLHHFAIEIVEGLFGVAPASRASSETMRMPGQRRAQLVRDGGQQLALVGHLLLDARGHVVDRVGDQADLVGLVTRSPAGRGPRGHPSPMRFAPPRVSSSSGRASLRATRPEATHTAPKPMAKPEAPSARRHAGGSSGSHSVTRPSGRGPRATTGTS
jgi:hypothetical protein